MGEVTAQGRGLASMGDREKGPKKIFEEIITKNVPNRGKETLKSRKYKESYTGTVI